jgi:hypothetical protein
MTGTGHALRRALRFQGAYYVVAGLWPVIDIASFERVTGPKVDDWLVKMVGLLAAVIGVTLATASTSRRPASVHVIVLAVGSAAAFMAIDTWYALTDRISPIYLADAVLELALITWLVLSYVRDRRVEHAAAAAPPPPSAVPPAAAPPDT